jgi:pantoate--beta-alanine ligase
MEIANTVKRAKEIVKNARKSNKKIGLVPTMGYLHEGHLSLVKQSKEHTDFTVVSIFVNPAQFGPNEDFDRYPRDFKRDEALLKEFGVDMVFYPTVDEMYPPSYSTYVNVEKITERLCGASRPGHFRGVATVVCKLFHIIEPDKAFFGLKDYQQFLVIKKMVSDLNMDINVIGVPIVREKDGLAMSSRNVYLSDEERKSALSLNKSFQIVHEELSKGNRDANAIIKKIEDFISSHPFTKIDYVEIVNPDTLEKIFTINGRFLYALAVYINKTRLIDNKIFEV